MQVRMLAHISDEIRQYEIGEIVDFDEYKARRFVAEEFAEFYAEPVATPDDDEVIEPLRRHVHVEAAAIEPPEHAVMPRSRRRLAQ